MTLPALLVLTDRHVCTGRSLVDVVASAVDKGARAVVLREKDLPLEDRLKLGAELRARLDPVGGVLIMAGAAGEAVHLAAADPFPSPRPSLVGRSCHTPDEVARAATEGCDYVTVSPVFPTPSKPGYGPPLGLDGLTRLCRSGVPTYALAGVRPADVVACRRAGAAGVAVMGAVMREPDIVAAYVAALQEVPE
jgi:thiamine-phosphate pyrophosphorylase